MSKYGLKELRLINSGSFKHEKINVDSSTLFLGSSGTGKTSILSVATFFYTFDTDKTRPDNQSKKFFDWHVPSPHSYIMYRYMNFIGEILLIIARDEGKIKFLFISLNNFTKDIEEIYLGEDEEAISYKEITATLIENKLDFYAADSINVARKVLHKNEYTSLSNKPLVDFSLFKKMNTTKLFGEHLFKIYKSSTIKDASIKQVLISLISEEERSLNLLELKRELNNSLSSIEEIEVINSKKNKIIELDNTIIEYDVIKENKSLHEHQIYSIRNHAHQFEQVIMHAKVEQEAKKNNAQELLTNKKEERKKSINGIEKRCLDLEYEIKQTKKDEKLYKDKKIELLLDEANKEEEYKEKFSNFTTEILAISSDITTIDEKEASDKQSKTVSLGEEKMNLVASLHKEEKNLTSNKISLLEEQNGKLNDETQIIIDKIEKIHPDIIALEKEIYTRELWIQEEPNRELKNDKTKNFNDLILTLTKRLTGYKEELKTSTDAIQNINKIQSDAVRSSSTKREDLILQFDDDVQKINGQVTLLRKRLNLGKNNLFSYLNEISHPHINKILAVINEELLFSEKFSFKSIETNETFFGIDIQGELEPFYKKYNIEAINLELENLRTSRSTLLAKHNLTISNIDDEDRKRDKKHKSEMLTIRRKFNEADSLSKTMDFRIKKEEENLSEELERMRLALEKEIRDKKDLNNDDYSKLKNLNSIFLNLQKEKTTIRGIITKEFDTKIDGINGRLQSITIELDSIDATYKTKIDIAMKTITDIYLKVKAEKNIDDVMFKKLKKQVEELTQKLSNINSNRVYVEYFLNDLKPRIEGIDDKNELLKTLYKSKEEEEALFKGVISSLGVDLNTFVVQITKWETYEKSYKEFMANVGNLSIASDDIGEVYTDSEILEILKSNNLKNSYDTYISSLSDISHSEGSIKNLVNIITRGVKQNNILNLKTQLDIDAALIDSINEYIAVSVGYIKYVKEKLDIEGVSLQLKSLHETINRSAAQLQYIKTDIELIMDEVSRVNKTMREGVSNINVIDYIQLNFYSYNGNEVALKLESINEKLSKNYSILFNRDDETNKAKDEIVNESKELLEVLESTSKKFISVSDISRLTFDVGENGNKHNGLTTLDTTGSNGTSIMVRTIIYLTLLKSVSLKVSHLDDISYHCILDEIGQISADYFNELLQYTKNLGFFFLNGSASNDEDIISCYEKFYSGIKVGNKTKMIEYINMELE